MDIEVVNETRKLVDNSRDRVQYIILGTLLLSPMYLVISPGYSPGENLSIKADLYFMFIFMVALSIDNWLNWKVLQGENVRYGINVHWFLFKVTIVVCVNVYFVVLANTGLGISYKFSSAHNVVALFFMVTIIWSQEILMERLKHKLESMPSTDRYEGFENVIDNESAIVEYLRENKPQLSRFCFINARSTAVLILLSLIINVNYSIVVKDNASDDILELLSFVAHYILVFACFETPTRRIGYYNSLILNLRTTLRLDSKLDITVKFINIEPDRGFIVSFYVSLLFFILKVLIG